MTAAAQTVTILQDSREQNPLRITKFPVRVEALTLCRVPPLWFDYGIEHFSSPSVRGFAVERKSVQDLAGSLTNGRDNFILHIECMQFYQFAALLIEGRPEQIEMKEYVGDGHPNSIFATLDAIQVRAGIHVCWAGDPWSAARQLEGWVDQYVGGIERRGRLIGMGFPRQTKAGSTETPPPEYITSAAAKGGRDPELDKKLDQWSPRALGNPLAAASAKAGNRHTSFVRANNDKT